MDPNFEDVGIEIDGDLIFVTVAKFKLFMSRGAEGMDAYALYSLLMFTARLQKTNSVWANEEYLKTGLGWGKSRLRKAKELLFELGLIEYSKQVKNEFGHFEKRFIVVKTSSKIESFTVGLPTARPSNRSRLSNDKCFNEKDKCFNEKRNIIYIQDSIKSIIKEYKIATGRQEEISNILRRCCEYIDDEVGFVFNNDFEDIFKNNSVDKICEAIRLYGEVLKSEDHWYTNKVPLLKFLKETMFEYFLPELNPLVELKKQTFNNKSKDLSIVISANSSQKVRTNKQARQDYIDNQVLKFSKYSLTELKYAVEQNILEKDAYEIIINLENNKNES